MAGPNCRPLESGSKPTAPGKKMKPGGRIPGAEGASAGGGTRAGACGGAQLGVPEGTELGVQRRGGDYTLTAPPLPRTRQQGARSPIHGARHREGPVAAPAPLSHPPPRRPSAPCPVRHRPLLPAPSIAPRLRRARASWGPSGSPCSQVADLGAQIPGDARHCEQPSAGRRLTLSPSLAALL